LKGVDRVYQSTPPAISSEEEENDTAKESKANSATYCATSYGADIFGRTEEKRLVTSDNLKRFSTK
jgi:hypothetical protein